MDSHPDAPRQRTLALDDPNEHETTLLAPDHLQLITSLFPVLAWAADASGARTYHNDRFLEYTGLQPQDVEGWSWLDVAVHPDDAQRVRDAWPACELDRRCHYEYRLRARDGSYRWFLDRAEAVPGPDGSVARWVGALVDIHERKVAEERASFQAHLLDAIDQATIATDPQGTITYWNRFAEQLYGWRADEVLGQHINDVTVPEIALDQANEIMARLQAGESWGGEFNVHRRDGSVFPADVFDSPVLNDRGALIGIIGVSRDVTDRRKSEQALRDTAERLRVAVSASPMFVFEQDRDLRYTWVNRACDGLSVDQVIGATDESVFSPDEARRVTEIKRGVIETGERAREEVNGTFGDRQYTFDMTVEPRRDASGEVIGIIGAAFDVTERKLIEDELRRANAAKDEFLSLVSHELKTPITIVMGNAEVLSKRHRILDEETRDEALRDIRDETDRLHRIIDDLLVLARLEGGRSIESEPLLLQRIVRACAERHGRVHVRREVRVHVEGDPGPVEGADTALQQVITNLLSNAEKYSPPDAPIDVFVAARDDAVEVTVCDRGAGIKPEEAERLFDPFYRSASTAEGTSGIGIGLAVCRRLVEAHGGRIWAQPRDGGGSVFGFLLPTESPTVPARKPARIG